MQQDLEETNTPVNTIFSRIVDEQKLTEIFDVINRITEGKTYLVGSFLFSSIASKMKGAEFSHDTLTFLTDGIGKVDVPYDWKVERTRRGSIKFTTPKYTIFVKELKDHPYLRYRSLPATIESYLDLVPLTIQSLAYDLQEQTLRGREGMKSLLSGEVGINNHSMATRLQEKVAKVRNSCSDLGFDVTGKNL